MMSRLMQPVERSTKPATRLAGWLPTILLSWFLSAALLAVDANALDSNSSSSSDKEATEQKLAEVRKSIENIRSQLKATRADHRAEQQRLEQQDLAIQSANLALRDLVRKASEHQSELESLNMRQREYLDQLESGMESLAQQLRASYTLGSQSRLKLLLNQDNIADINRTQAYYDYVNRAQATRMTDLQEILQGLDELQRSVHAELARLQEVSIQQQEVLEELTQQRIKRAEILAELDARIQSDSARLAEAERDRKDLETLLERLSSVLADIPAELGSQPDVKQLKGRLPMPLKGRVRHAYGQRRSANMRWQGWLIEASTGSEVKAIAHGRVAFADWLRGYGLLMIIDHGDGYLSLYGNNESLLHDVGAWVEAGEAISVVGDNPGSDQGLYFELRRDGKAVDPAAWIARR